MPAPAPQRRYSYADYVDLEDDELHRHEYYDGNIYSMAGGTPDHAAISASLGASLVTQLRGKGSRVYSSGLMVRVLATGLATYPDVTVVCGATELDPDKRHAVTNPRLIVEITSPTTAEYDRGATLEHYRQITSLQEILLVAHDRHEVTVWRRTADAAWTSDVFTEGSVALTSIPATLDIADVYRDELSP